MMGLGKPHQPAYFEVDTFSHCKNIKGEPTILGSSPNPGPRPLFLMGGIMWWVFAKPTCLPILKSLDSVVAKILKGNPKIWGAPLAHGHADFVLRVFLWWPLANPNCVPNLKSLTSTVAEILKGDHKILGSFPRPRPRPLFSAWDFMMGFGKP